MCPGSAGCGILTIDILPLQVQHFVNHKLGLSERQLQTVTWPEVARRIVQACLCRAATAVIQARFMCFLRSMKTCATGLVDVVAR